mmetsp:Transcript_3335/g.7845  ORF Transcript_3335/g.7845 Transcript_3335/m.7845 type:complete len:353 (-) Transcript_3335:680-1738(-)|eukprot:g3591.t1
MAAPDSTFVIFGGLGRQGKSVADNLFELFPDAKVKLVTRSADLGSDKCKQATANRPNFTVVTGDLSDPASLDAVLGAEPVYGVFLVTAFWPAAVDAGTGASKPLDAGFERDCAINCAKACMKHGVKHLVFSMLEQTTLHSDFNADGAFKKEEGTGYVVPHFDGKGDAALFMNEQTEMAVDFLMVAFYMENWFGMKPSKGEDGKYALYLPLNGKPHFETSFNDVGKVAAPLFKRLPKHGDGKFPGTGAPSWPLTGVVGVKHTGEEIAKSFEKIIGEPVAFVDVPVEGWIAAGVAQGMPEVVARDFGQMFGFYQCESAIAPRDKAYEEGIKAGNLAKFDDFLAAVKPMLYPPAA